MVNLYSIRLAIFALFLLLFTSGCVETVTGIDAEEEEPTPVAMVTVYDLHVKTHFIHVTGSCDKALGQPTSGEFQYRYEFNGEGKSFDLESQNYNSRFGVVHNRVAGQQINFKDETYSWSGLQKTDGIEVTLSGTEWDGAIRDGDMSDRSGSRTVPYKLGSSPRTITIGANSSCQIYLSYTAEWRTREVPA